MNEMMILHLISKRTAICVFAYNFGREIVYSWDIYGVRPRTISLFHMHYVRFVIALLLTVFLLWCRVLTSICCAHFLLHTSSVKFYFAYL